MKAVFWGFILLGVMLLGAAVRDEHRGIASVHQPLRSMVPAVAIKAQNPEGFKGLMAYEWLRGGLVMIAGWIGLGFARRADRLDPFSPNFAGNQELDELSKELDREKRIREQTKS